MLGFLNLITWFKNQKDYLIVFKLQTGYFFELVIEMTALHPHLAHTAENLLLTFYYRNT